MAVNVSEYMNKFQEEGLAAIKETQDASLKAMNSFREFTKEMSEKPGSRPGFREHPDADPARRALVRIRQPAARAAQGLHDADRRDARRDAEAGRSELPVRDRPRFRIDASQQVNP